MIVSRSHRLGEPVLIALGSVIAPEGDRYRGGTLLVAPGLPAIDYVMLDPDTREQVGVLTLPDDLADARAWHARAGETINRTMEGT